MAINQRIIGLTGGIGCGKTTVSNYLGNNYKIPVLDADIYAREAVEPDSPIFNLIVERYTDDILLPNGILDRKKLGNIIFNNLSDRHWLEQQIHPYVRKRFEEELNKLPQENYPTVVLVIPLLFESKMTDLVTEIWVVYCNEQAQITRLIERDRLSLEQAKARINSQMPIAEKCQQADIILDNSDTLETLLKQVDLAISS